MTSETGKFDDGNSVSEQNQSGSMSRDVKKKCPKLCTDMNSVKGPTSVNKEMERLRKESVENNQKTKKSPEMCGIHSRNAAEKKEPQIVTEMNFTSLSLKNEFYPDTGVCEADKENKAISSELIGDNFSSCSDLTSTPVLSCNRKSTNQSIEQSDKTDSINLLPNEASTAPLDKGTKTKTKSDPFEPKKNVAFDSGVHSLTAENVLDTNSPHSLPDILSTLNKPPSNEGKREASEFSESPLPDSVDSDKGISPKPKSLLSQTNYLPNLLSSESLHKEMEMELKQFQCLHSLQANQSIYKLAYDENDTDQSEADSRSPSPVDPESQVPSSITSAEILIHEADSGSDAGSEDVELLPHRYESETFRNESKHVYVNKLSLAVELLRTQESLPYDDEFKRVVGENQINNALSGIHTGGQVNASFAVDSYSPNRLSTAKHFENKSESTNTHENDVSQYQLKHSANSSNDSAIFSDIEFDNFEKELGEAAKEVVAQGSETQDNSEEIRAEYRRIGVQARHYFSPSAALSLNPCFCCVIM